MIDYQYFLKSLNHLQAQFLNYQSLDPALPELMREAVAESVIQRFEICYDCLWKVLKRYLIEVMGIPDAPNSPKPIFRLAAENNLLPSAIARWLDYAEARIHTTHDYSGEKAKACLLLMEDFIRDATVLYQSLSKQDGNASSSY